MCRRVARPDPGDVTDTHIVIGLELHQADDTLSGRITAADGRIVPFSGWLGLVAALDALVNRAAADGRDPRSPSTHLSGGPQ
jgi:hypothetical protein